MIYLKTSVPFVRATFLIMLEYHILPTKKTAKGKALKYYSNCFTLSMEIFQNALTYHM